jgi:hypothetical protein
VSGCSKSYEAKKKSAHSEYLYWIADHNIAEGVFVGPTCDSAFIENAVCFKWWHHDESLSDTLRIVVCVEERRFWLSEQVFLEGSTDDWRKISKSKYQ